MPKVGRTTGSMVNILNTVANMLENYERDQKLPGPFYVKALRQAASRMQYQEEKLNSRFGSDKRTSLVLKIRKDDKKLIKRGGKVCFMLTRRPRLDPPFRCYMYRYDGIVYGEFVCDNLYTVHYKDLKNKKMITELTYGLGMSLADIVEKAGWVPGVQESMKDFYVLHIQDPKFYSKPYPLTELGVKWIPQDWKFVMMGSSSDEEIEKEGPYDELDIDDKDAYFSEDEMEDSTQDNTEDDTEP